jgi:hypothetical protein
MHQILHTEDIVLAQLALNHRIIRQRDPLLLHFPIPPLIHQLAHALQVRLAVGHIRLDQTEHLLRRLGDLDEDAVVDLQETQELEDLARFWRDLVDAADADDEVDLWLGGDVEVAGGAGGAFETDFFALFCEVFFYVGFGALEDDLALGFCGLWMGVC